ncbi:VOC family protein [Streptomyces sp. MST-110588]|uniref:VOC family protein n=1 Tax=Streptomyces sp. MST-110588 TaxID=2833628 RepID=UPI001F5C7D4D|nr:VOC family protein [Streptomyces sp. MST-110588]UNO38962.1 VOC family protein [Streptomyces sp. MST-110588]
MPIAKLRTTVLDCPDPHALAGFYAQVLGGRIKNGSDPEENWVDLFVDGSLRLSFQRAPGFVPPQWPRADHSQQIHLDLDVPDMEKGQEQVLALGARPLDLDDEGGKRDFRVYADPAGHPFCLIRT